MILPDNNKSEGKQLSQSLEDYLEAIALIIAEKKSARAKDISERLDVSRASVTEAFRALAKKGLINYAPYELITLTREGEKLAADVIHRHKALKDFFINILAVEEDIADKGACRIEHTAPRQIIDRMIEFVKFIEVCPRGGSELIEKFNEFCREETTENKCESCIAKLSK